MSPEALKSMVESLLAALGARVDAVSVSDGPRTVVSVSSPESKDLIGPRGEHLQALNTIARRLVEVRAGREASGEDRFAGDAPAFLIDVNGYHEAKLEEVREKARLLAARARLFKHEVELPPMSSYERLVIHEMFADDPEIETVSAGEGKFRHVVLRYKSPAASN